MASYPLDIIICWAMFGIGVGLFTYVGVSLFTTGWKSYESRYVEGAAQTLDAMYLTMPVQHVLYLGFLAAIVLGVLFYLISGTVLGALPIAMLGFLVPRGVLWYLKRKRDRMFLEQLVDVLMNISNSLKAGFSLPQAFELVQREMPNPTSQEFRLVCQEMRLGVSTDEALQHLYQRMPSADLDLVVTAIGITRDVGGNLTEVFDNIAHTIRERMRIEGKITSLTAQGRAQAVVLCMMPFALGLALYLVQPGYIEPLYTTSVGGLVIAGLIVLELLGAYVIYRIVNIDV